MLLFMVTKTNAFHAHIKFIALIRYVLVTLYNKVLLMSIDALTNKEQDMLYKKIQPFIVS